ncbi:MAG: hypothetical protein LBV61_07285 [Burkholderiaceae bacterium]|jgi:alpha-tubulin suppressor-like RCC1 family protein|nr:hypothetical protein [Burkholderiaceae bacterium]
MTPLSKRRPFAALGLSLVLFLVLLGGCSLLEQREAAQTTFQQVAAGGGHTCGLTRGGGVRCWGNNREGELGHGGAAGSLTPVDVQGLASGVAAISAGRWFTCALTRGGGVKCWGGNDYGQLGDGSAQTRRRTPVDVRGLARGVAAISTGLWHTCALTIGGGVKCWGWNTHGQLGDGTGIQRLTPVEVVNLDHVVSLSAGDTHTCAVTRSGGVKCWGNNGSGQRGDGGSGWGRPEPVEVAGIHDAVAVSAGGEHTCALTRGGVVKCWGSNDKGQLGDGSRTTRWTPAEVQGLAGGVAAISAGEIHTCALTNAGALKCWGGNGFTRMGEDSFLWNALGDGSDPDHDTHSVRGHRTAPVDVQGLSAGVSAISAGRGYTCAVTGDGAIKCWGSNNFGQLGDGSTAKRLTPVDVRALPVSPIQQTDENKERDEE